MTMHGYDATWPKRCDRFRGVKIEGRGFVQSGLRRVYLRDTDVHGLRGGASRTDQQGNKSQRKGVRCAHWLSSWAKLPHSLLLWQGMNREGLPRPIKNAVKQVDLKEAVSKQSGQWLVKHAQIKALSVSFSCLSMWRCMCVEASLQRTVGMVTEQRCCRVKGGNTAGGTAWERVQEGIRRKVN